MSTTFPQSHAEQQSKRPNSASEVRNRLILSQANPELLTRINAACGQEGIGTSQNSDWRMDEGGLLEIVMHAVDNDIQDIVIIGDSQSFTDHTTERSESGDTLNSSSSNLLFERAAFAANKRLAMQERFAVQIKDLVSNPNIDAKLQEGSLSVSALFYRAEADVFMVYEIDCDEFKMLA